MKIMILLFAKILILIFIFCMLFLILFWCLPKGYFLRDFLHQTFGKFIYWASLDNYWALFAPQPVSKNFLIGFELEFPSGKIFSWQLKEYTIKNGFQHAPHFRFIKWHNQLLSQKDPIPKKAMCRYILNKFLELDRNTDLELPSKIHILRFHESDGFLPWVSKRIFTYECK